MAERSLENYITVKERKQRFYIDNPDGRIIPDLISSTNDSCVYKVSCYKNPEEQENNLPMATGYAQEFKGIGGFANKTSWLENCEESAVGRCLDNAGFAVSKTCSREEIIAADRNKKALAEQTAIKQKYATFLKNTFKGKEYEARIEKARNMTVADMEKLLMEIDD